MNFANALKILVIVLAVSIVLTQTASAIEIPITLATDATPAKVPPATVIWEKTYGGPADDRAYCAVTAAITT